MSRLTRDGTAEPSRETEFSGAYGDTGIFIFPVQLTRSRIGNLTRLIHTLLYVMTIHMYTDRSFDTLQRKTPTNRKSVKQTSLFHTEHNLDQLDRLFMCCC